MVKFGGGSKEVDKTAKLVQPKAAPVKLFGSRAAGKNDTLTVPQPAVAPATPVVPAAPVQVVPVPVVSVPVARVPAVQPTPLPKAPEPREATTAIQTRTPFRELWAGFIEGRKVGMPMVTDALKSMPKEDNKDVYNIMSRLHKTDEKSLVRVGTLLQKGIPGAIEEISDDSAKLLAIGYEKALSSASLRSYAVLGLKEISKRYFKPEIKEKFDGIYSALAPSPNQAPTAIARRGYEQEMDTQIGNRSGIEVLKRESAVPQEIKLTESGKARIRESGNLKGYAEEMLKGNTGPEPVIYFIDTKEGSDREIAEFEEVFRMLKESDKTDAVIAFISELNILYRNTIKKDIVFKTVLDGLAALAEKEKFADAVLSCITVKPGKRVFLERQRMDMVELLSIHVENLRDQRALKNARTVETVQDLSQNPTTEANLQELVSEMLEGNLDSNSVVLTIENMKGSDDEIAELKKAFIMLKDSEQTEVVVKFIKNLSSAFGKTEGIVFETLLKGLVALAENEKLRSAAIDVSKVLQTYNFREEEKKTFVDALKNHFEYMYAGEGQEIEPAAEPAQENTPLIGETAAEIPEEILDASADAVEEPEEEVIDLPDLTARDKMRLSIPMADVLPEEQVDSKEKLERDVHSNDQMERIDATDILILQYLKENNAIKISQLLENPNEDVRSATVAALGEAIVNENSQVAAYVWTIYNLKRGDLDSIREMLGNEKVRALVSNELWGALTDSAISVQKNAATVWAESVMEYQERQKLEQLQEILRHGSNDVKLGASYGISRYYIRKGRVPDVEKLTGDRDQFVAQGAKKAMKEYKVENGETDPELEAPPHVPDTAHASTELAMNGGKGVHQETPLSMVGSTQQGHEIEAETGMLIQKLGGSVEVDYILLKKLVGKYGEMGKVAKVNKLLRKCKSQEDYGKLINAAKAAALLNSENAENGCRTLDELLPQMGPELQNTAIEKLRQVKERHTDESTRKAAKDVLKKVSFFGKLKPAKPSKEAEGVSGLKGFIGRYGAQTAVMGATVYAMHGGGEMPVWAAPAVASFTIVTYLRNRKNKGGVK